MLVMRLASTCKVSIISRWLGNCDPQVSETCWFGVDLPWSLHACSNDVEETGTPLTVSGCGSRYFTSSRVVAVENVKI